MKRTASSFLALKKVLVTQSVTIDRTPIGSRDAHASSLSKNEDIDSARELTLTDMLVELGHLVIGQRKQSSRTHSMHRHSVCGSNLWLQRSPKPATARTGNRVERRRRLEASATATSFFLRSTRIDAWITQRDVEWRWDSLCDVPGFPCFSSCINLQWDDNLVSYWSLAHIPVMPDLKAPFSVDGVTGHQKMAGGEVEILATMQTMVKPCDQSWNEIAHHPAASSTMGSPRDTQVWLSRRKSELDQVQMRSSGSRCDMM